MSELERRALLGAAGIGALAAMSKAGPLNPPAGAVASTGRTTDEIYNKIPAGGAGDGRIAIAAGNNIVINNPGSYVLTGNIGSSVGGTAITVGADNVTLDLNGYTVGTAATSGNGVILSSNLTKFVLRNGTISGFNVGVALANNCNCVVLEGLVIKEPRVFGILASGVSPRAITVRRCTVVDTGLTTVAADGNLIISAISLTGSCHLVEECSVHRLFYNGGGVGTFRAIAFNTNPPGGTGNQVVRCTVTHDGTLTGTALQFFSNGIYRDNTVMNFTTPAVGGTNGGGNV